MFLVCGHWVTMWSVDPICRSGWVECRRRMNVAWSCLDLATQQSRPSLVITEADQQYRSVHELLMDLKPTCSRGLTFGLG